MALQLLATENLLAMITVLMSTMNFQQSKIRGLLTELKKYFEEDINIRERLERKADRILDKMQGEDE